LRVKLPVEWSKRPADIAVRRANLGRAAQLFTPYWWRQAILCGLIQVSAGLGVMPTFLLKHALEAIGRHNYTTLALAASRMIVVAVVNGVLGVTLLSNKIGQRVMLGLRDAVSFMVVDRNEGARGRSARHLPGAASPLLERSVATDSRVLAVAGEAPR
jgi:hypothetical protein